MADTEPANFIEDIVEEHNGNGRFGGRGHHALSPRT